MKLEFTTKDEIARTFSDVVEDRTLVTGVRFLDEQEISKLGTNPICDGASYVLAAKRSTDDLAKPDPVTSQTCNWCMVLISGRNPTSLEEAKLLKDTGKDTILIFVHKDLKQLQRLKASFMEPAVSAWVEDFIKDPPPWVKSPPKTRKILMTPDPFEL